MLRKAILTVVLLLVLYPSESRSQTGRIWLDNVIGEIVPGEIGLGRIELQLHVMNNSPYNKVVGSNSFMLCPNAPVSITGFQGSIRPGWAALYDATYMHHKVLVANSGNWSWQVPPPIAISGGDTAGVGFAGLNLFSTRGMPIGYTDWVWTIEFWTQAGDVGKQICLEKADPYIYYWEWASGINTLVPDWSGPYCFTIVAAGLTPISDPSGSPVEVEVDEVLTVTFDDVTSAGITTVTAQTTGPAPPDGYKIVPVKGQPVYYNIETTAEYSGDITVCFTYNPDDIKGSESDLTLLHEIDGDWTPLTSWVDEVANVICGVTSSLSLFALAEPIQSIAGQVVADCPAPLIGLLGVDVDAFALGTGDLVGTAVTDADGHYLIADLPAADYTVTLVTPLGFSTEIDEILIAEQPGQTVVVDFALTCIDITANPRGIGFWKHQVGVALGGKGNAQIDKTTLCDYLDMIANHFNSNEINQVVVYDPPISNVCADKLLVTKKLLNLKGNVGLTARAKQQLTALLMNVAAGYISQVEVISEDGATVSQAITYCDNLIDNPSGDHDLAKTICDDINNGRPISVGIIPLSTAQIAYKQLPGTYFLSQNYPNPFNPETEIRFSLPAGSHVMLEVFNSTGQSVTTLMNRHVDAGNHSVSWDASGVASGVYLYRLTAGKFVETKKMVVLK